MPFSAFHKNQIYLIEITKMSSTFNSGHLVVDDTPPAEGVLSSIKKKKMTCKQFLIALIN